MEGFYKKEKYIEGYDSVDIKKDFMNGSSFTIHRKVPIYGERDVFVEDTPISEEERLRGRRSYECFEIINRGMLWYNSLTAQQLEELAVWYKSWLDVTDTKKIPQKPSWL